MNMSARITGTLAHPVGRAQAGRVAGAGQLCTATETARMHACAATQPCAFVSAPLHCTHNTARVHWQVPPQRACAVQEGVDGCAAALRDVAAAPACSRVGHEDKSEAT